MADNRNSLQDRRARALRANLRRRKAQQRSRAADEPPAEPDSGESSRRTPESDS